MARSLFLTLAAASVALAAATTPASAQSTVTTTTTTKTVGGITSQTTVTEETSVIGEPASPVVPAPATAGAGVPAAGAPSATDEVMTKAGIRYACTGVAKDSREDPRWQDFAAKLVFTVQGGGYLPDVLTRIEDQQGNEVFTARCDGPWLLLDLPADSYRVVATAEDPRGEIHQRTADISVGARGQSETIIRFDDIPG